MKSSLNVEVSREKKTLSFWHPKTMNSILAEVNILSFYFLISSFLPSTSAPLSQDRAPCEPFGGVARFEYRADIFDVS